MDLSRVYHSHTYLQTHPRIYIFDIIQVRLWIRVSSSKALVAHRRECRGQMGAEQAGLHVSHPRGQLLSLYPAAAL